MRSLARELSRAWSRPARNFSRARTSRADSHALKSRAQVPRACSASSDALTTSVQAWNGSVD
eukprot:3834655-Pleurochrysis_carterae.AAC.1